MSWEEDEVSWMARLLLTFWQVHQRHDHLLLHCSWKQVTKTVASETTDKRDHYTTKSKWNSSRGHLWPSVSIYWTCFLLLSQKESCPSCPHSSTNTLFTYVCLHVFFLQPSSHSKSSPFYSNLFQLKSRNFPPKIPLRSSKSTSVSSLLYMMFILEINLKLF